MHPNEFFPRDLLQDRDLVLTYVTCLSALTPVFQHRLIGGSVVELQPNDAIIERPLESKLIDEVTFVDKLDLLKKLNLVQVNREATHYKVRLLKIRFEPDCSRIPVDAGNEHELPPITFAAFSERYLKQVEVDTSRKNLENSCRVVKHANRHFGNVLLEKLEPRHLDDYKAKRLAEIQAAKGPQAGKTTVNIDVRTLKRALEYAIDWGYLRENPFRRIKTIRQEDKSPMAMSRQELSDLLVCVEDEQLKKFYIVAALTGMRRGELVYLRWSDVDLDTQIISIQSSAEYRVKAGKGRMIPISEAVVRILETLKENDPYVFANEKGSHYKEDYVTKKFKEAVREADLKEEYHFHCLRHSFATWIATAGVSALHIKELMGHAYVKTTESYTRIPASDLRCAVETLTLPPVA